MPCASSVAGSSLQAGVVNSKLRGRARMLPWDNPYELYVSSGMMESLYRYLISPYELTAPRYGDRMGLDLTCGTNYSGFRSRQPLPPPGQTNVQTRRFVPIPTRAGNASSNQAQAGNAPVRAPDHQSVGTVGQRVRACPSNPDAVRVSCELRSESHHERRQPLFVAILRPTFPRNEATCLEPVFT